MNHFEEFVLVCDRLGGRVLEWHPLHNQEKLEKYCEENVSDSESEVDATLITWAASISKSCFWISNEVGRNRQMKNKSDLTKNDSWVWLQADGYKD